MCFIHRRTSRQTGKVKNLLRLTLLRLARCPSTPPCSRKSISRGDVGQLLALGHQDGALQRAHQVIEEENMLEAFDMVELYCNRLIEHAVQLDKPHECDEDIREAAAGIFGQPEQQLRLQLRTRDSIRKRLPLRTSSWWIFQSFLSQDSSCVVPHHDKFNHETMYHDDRIHTARPTDKSSIGQPEPNRVKATACT